MVIWIAEIEEYCSLKNWNYFPETAIDMIENDIFVVDCLETAIEAPADFFDKSDECHEHLLAQWNQFEEEDDEDRSSPPSCPTSQS